jgi:hypothetical protein
VVGGVCLIIAQAEVKNRIQNASEMFTELGQAGLPQNEAGPAIRAGRQVPYSRTGSLWRNSVCGLLKRLAARPSRGCSDSLAESSFPC